MKHPALARSELFSGLPELQARRIEEIAVSRSLKPGEILFRLGEDANEIFVIASGSVELTFPLLVMGELKDVRFQSLDAGRALAWSALVPPHKLTMSARATTQTDLIAIPRKGLLDLLQAEPSIGYAVVFNLAGVIGARLHEQQALWVREVQRNVAQTYR